MPATNLRWRALWLALGWAIAAAIVWLSLVPSPPKLDVTLGDKIGHFVGYGTLMFWFCQLYGSRRARAVHALGFAAMGIALEFLQGMIGYRTFEVMDMVANALGVLVGWAGARLVGGGWLARVEAALARRPRA
jgi:VanZ family protein